MKSSNGLSKGRRDVNGVELGALGLEMVMGDSVCADDLEKLRQDHRYLLEECQRADMGGRPELDRVERSPAVHHHDA